MLLIVIFTMIVASFVQVSERRYQLRVSRLSRASRFAYFNEAKMAPKAIPGLEQRNQKKVKGPTIESPSTSSDSENLKITSIATVPQVESLESI